MFLEYFERLFRGGEFLELRHDGDHGDMEDALVVFLVLIMCSCS